MAISIYFNNIIKVLAIGAGFASLPLLASLASLQPPWPPAIGIVSAGLIMAGSLIIWEWTRRTRVQNRRRWILGSVLLSIAALLLYLFLYSQFVENVPGTTDRVIRGFTCTPDALKVYKSECPDLSSDALADASWKAGDLWTRPSITAVRLGLTITWLAFTAGLIMTVGAVVAGRKF